MSPDAAFFFGSSLLRQSKLHDNFQTRGNQMNLLQFSLPNTNCKNRATGQGYYTVYQALRPPIDPTNDWTNLKSFIRSLLINSDDLTGLSASSLNLFELKFVPEHTKWNTASSSRPLRCLSVKSDKYSYEIHVLAQPAMSSVFCLYINFCLSSPHLLCHAIYGPFVFLISIAQRQVNKWFGTYKFNRFRANSSVISLLI